MSGNHSLVIGYRIRVCKCEPGGLTALDVDEVLGSASSACLATSFFVFFCPFESVLTLTMERNKCCKNDQTRTKRRGED